ncbi:MAG TPA: hypothetical protein VL147_12380, partial [Devosia sp.]|nr:hypothetical protein [Devosia sp.]
PITMAEFRADKDQLRAEFALSTRRLEMNVDTLRKRLTEQLSDVDRKRTDLGALKAERDQHLIVVSELEVREAELRARVTELERDGTDLAQRLRMRERELSNRAEEVDTLRQGLLGTLPKGTDPDANGLTGDYDHDAEHLLTALTIERKRADFLEQQARSLIARLESSDKRSTDANAAIAQMRDALAQKDDQKAADTDSLVAAEARIANAENRLNAILAETGTIVQKAEGHAQQLLADKLSLEDELEALRAKVEGVESILLTNWDTERLDEAQMRERLNDIASSVSRLVYAVESEKPLVHGPEESLFDKVQRFADDGKTTDTLPKTPPPGKRKGGSVTDRMAALREIQGR